MFSSEQLIQAVEAHPCIWNPNDDFYSSNQSKIWAWNEILTGLLEDYEDLSAGEKLIKRQEIKKRWNNIKDFYRKYCIKKIQGKTKSRYIHARLLKFLDNVMDLKRSKNKRSASNNDSMSDNLDNSNDDFGNQEDDVKLLVKSYTIKDSEKLISIIKKHPPLWDKSACCKSTRHNHLTEIAAEMEPKYSSFDKTQQQSFRLALLKRWYNMRDSYKKNMKALASGRTMKPYIFFKHLEFLDPIYEYERDVNLNIDDVGDADDAGEAEYLDDDFIDNNDDDDDEGVSGGWASKFFVDINDIEPKGKKIKRTKDVNDLQSSIASLVKINSDEDMAFFKSILPDVKTLSQDAKMDFKIKVLKMLKGLQGKVDVLSSTVKMEDESDNSD